MTAKPVASKRRALRWLRDPTIHFFVLGALVFAVHRLVVGDPRTIVVTTALRADLERRFRDQSGRYPTAAEIETTLRDWKRDEALYREAVRDQLDRDDATIRSVLIEKVRHREQLLHTPPEPTPADLEDWLARHREGYARPRIYEHEYVVVAKSDPEAEPRCDEYEQALNAGTSPAALGLRTVAAKVGKKRIEAELGTKLADQIAGLKVGRWHSLEDKDRWVLVRVTRVEGGLPNAEVLRPRLVTDWKAKRQEEAVERAVQAIVDRYRFEEKSP